MRHRHTLPLLLAALWRAATAAAAAAAPRLTAASAPNIVFVMSDDLGYGEVSYSPGRTNTNLTTPHLDALAASGMTFRYAYAGAPVCAPSRGTFMTGKHTGHATIRGNHDTAGANLPLAQNDTTFLQVLREAGYVVACVGKWGLGEVNSTGDPIKKGCSTFFGGTDQSAVHNMYPSEPSFTWRWPAADGSEAWEGVGFPENVNASRARCMGSGGGGCTWSHDLWTQGANAALTAHAERLAALGPAAAPPLFLYLAYTDPHAGGWSGTAEKGNPVPSDGAFAAEPWPDVERDHASVIVNYMDRDVGALVARIGALGLAPSTAIFFASDNGASNEGGACWRARGRGAHTHATRPAAAVCRRLPAASPPVLRALRPLTHC